MSRVAGEVVHLVHGLGLLGVVLGAVGYPALALAGRRRERTVLRRGALLLAVEPGKRRRRRSMGGARVRELAALLGAVVTGWILVGGPLGCAAGLAAAYGTWRWQRTRHRHGPGVPAAEVAETAQQLPLAADLLAACISAGAGPREAAEAVGDSLGGPVGERLARTAAEIRLGGEPAVSWGGSARYRAPVHWPAVWSERARPGLPRRSRSPAWPRRCARNGRVRPWRAPSGPAC